MRQCPVYALYVCLCCHGHASSNKLKHFSFILLCHKLYSVGIILEITISVFEYINKNHHTNQHTHWLVHYAFSHHFNYGKHTIDKYTASSCAHLSGRMYSKRAREGNKSLLMYGRQQKNTCWRVCMCVCASSGALFAYNVTAVVSSWILHRINWWVYGITCTIQCPRFEISQRRNFS